MGRPHRGASSHAANSALYPAGSRRERILAAAIDAFARGGFEGASTREIAEAAGVTDPLLFYHFKSKSDLYLASVQDQLEKLREGLDEALAGAAGAHAHLRVFVEVYLRYFLDLEPGLTVTLRELNGLPPEAASAISETHHLTVMARLEEILVAGVQRGDFRPLNVPACALGIIGILQMFIRAEARNPGRYSREEAIAQVLEHYAVGLQPASNTGMPACTTTDGNPPG